MKCNNLLIRYLFMTLIYILSNSIYAVEIVNEKFVCVSSEESLLPVNNIKNISLITSVDTQGKFKIDDTEFKEFLLPVDLEKQNLYPQACILSYVHSTLKKLTKACKKLKVTNTSLDCTDSTISQVAYETISGNIFNQSHLVKRRKENPDSISYRTFLPMETVSGKLESMYQHHYQRAMKNIKKELFFSLFEKI